MWEITARVEVVERKSLCTKQNPYDIFTEFLVRIPVPAFLKPTRSVLRLD
jgi:hypothetical protein